jgi:cell division protease FtsH
VTKTAQKSWFPRGFLFPNGARYRKLVACDEDWQIVVTNTDSYTLATRKALREKWADAGFVGKHLLTDIEVGGIPCCLFESKHGYLISSVAQGPYPANSVQAHAFAISLRETRKLAGNIPLHDAIYIEQFSRLLPTYTPTVSFDDQTVLGTWLSAGVNISSASFRRLCKLLEWMDAAEVESIVRDADFPVCKSNYLVKIGSEDEDKEDALPYESNSLNEAAALPHRRFVLPGRPELEAFFNEHVIDIISNEEQYRRMGVEFPAAIVLQGPPGCGKTYAVERMVEFLDWPSYSIDSGSVGSPYIHDTSKKIADVFTKAIENAPSVIVIDEMEAFLTDRSVAQASGIHHVEEVAEFLRRIPDASKKRVLVIAMTNMISSIDSAILRRGRFDHIIEVKMPSSQEVHALLVSLFQKIPVSADIDIDALSEGLQERPMSDIAFVVKEAGRIAVKQGKDVIDNAMMIAACELLPGPKWAGGKIGF